MKLYEEFKLYENMWESVETSTLNEDWYGADAEVEFETSVYPDIAKYFGLKDAEVVTYAYYYTDEVIVNYDDAYGRSHEIEKHVPIDQVEEWFKAGYTILDEAKKHLTEATTDTVIITAHSFDEKIRVAKKDLALAKKLDRKACDIWESAEERYQDEDELCDKLGIEDFSSVEIFSKLAEDAGLEFDLVEDEALNLKEFVNTPSNISRALKWEDLLIKADELLDELCVKSGNSSWDDGDGYWSGDEEWCNRNLYYTRLANVASLEKLCNEYSKKLPKVEFYFYDDEEEETSEIGYTATR